MPIIGLTDNGAAFPRIGELRKGAEKPKQGNKPGADLTHFRFTSKAQDVLDSFASVYGNKPASINVFLPYATTDENLEAWIEEWAAGGLKWRGDGQTLAIWQTSEGTYSQEPKPQPKGGKQVGRLKVIIPELGRLAYVVALTTSTHDIMEIHSNLEAFEALRGDLRGIPFTFSRVPRMISTPSGQNGKRARREKWLWHIEASPQWVQAQLSVMQRQALPSGGQQLALPSSTIDHNTGEIIEPDNDVIEAEIVEVEPTFIAEDEILDSARNFLAVAVREIGRYKHPNAVMAAMKKLGMNGINGNREERLAQYKYLVLYARHRDNGMDEQAALEATYMPSLPFDIGEPATNNYQAEMV